jgi:hypothetical protein
VKIKLTCVLVLLWAMPVAAQETATEKSGPDPATARENPVSTVPYESGREGVNTCEDRWSNFLPIWGKAACQQGYVLPRPFGVSLGYMHMDQPFDVGGIWVNGIDVKTPGVAVVNEVDNEGTTLTLRLDAWILPFWNVYGLLGHIEGEATGPLTANLAPIFPTLCKLPGNNCQLDTTFDLDYDADVLGFGTTIAGGYKDFFGMLDINTTTANLNISTKDAEATVFSSRIGWNGKLGGFAGVLWVGAMYQDIEQTLVLESDIGTSLVSVEIEQSVAEPWNYLIGGQWDINRSVAVLAEFGFGERSSQMVNVTYRF